MAALWWMPVRAASMLGGLTAGVMIGSASFVKSPTTGIRSAAPIR
jgi:hypothetical protein